MLFQCNKRRVKCAAKQDFASVDSIAFIIMKSQFPYVTFTKRLMIFLLFHRAQPSWLLPEAQFRGLCIQCYAWNKWGGSLRKFSFSAFAVLNRAFWRCFHFWLQSGVFQAQTQILSFGNTCHDWAAAIWASPKWSTSTFQIRHCMSQLTVYGKRPYSWLYFISFSFIFLLWCTVIMLGKMCTNSSSFTKCSSLSLTLSFTVKDCPHQHKCSTHKFSMIFHAADLQGRLCYWILNWQWYRLTSVFVFL